MKSKGKAILVPSDFTRVVDYAMEHAVCLAKAMEAVVHVLHVTHGSEDVQVSGRRLNAEVARAALLDPSVPIKGMVREGNLYDAIDEAAEECGAQLIVMGTHGMRGMQFITGSRALRVVSHSKVPFIVVQDRGIKPEGYRNIVVPLDLERETRQKLALVAEMADYFKGKVHVVVPHESDEFLHRQLQDNITYAKKYFSERNIPLEASITPEDSNGFVKAVLAYATSIDADLIAVMNMVEGNIFGVLGLPYEEEIITNEAKIPVLMVHLTDNTAGTAGWTFQ